MASRSGEGTWGEQHDPISDSGYTARIRKLLNYKSNPENLVGRGTRSRSAAAFRQRAFRGIDQQVFQAERLQLGHRLGTDRAAVGSGSPSDLVPAVLALDTIAAMLSIASHISHTGIIIGLVSLLILSVRTTP